MGGPPGTPEKDIDWKISITLLTWLLDPSFPIYFSIKFFFLKFWGKLKKKEKKKRKPSSRREVVMLNISCSIWGGPAVSMQFGDMIMNFKKQRFWIKKEWRKEKRKKKKKKEKKLTRCFKEQWVLTISTNCCGKKLRIYWRWNWRRTCILCFHPWWWTDVIIPKG